MNAIRHYRSPKKQIKKVLFALITGICSSCTTTLDNNFGDYKCEIINVNPGELTKGLSVGEYSIDSICTISFPQNAVYPQINKLIVTDNNIYMLDTDNGHTVYVFETDGRYLRKLGERGRDVNEYIGSPTDFFVSQNGDVYVYDRIGYKIIVFDKQGKVTNIIPTKMNSVHSFGLTSNEKLLYCINEETLEENDNNPALVVCDKKGKVEKELIQFKQRYSFRPSNRTFFSNGDRLSHIPVLSDSILVFKNDSLEKVVRVDFNGHFLMKEMSEIAMDIRNFSKIKDYKGVYEINRYQETDSFVLLQYVYQSRVCFWLYNKTNGKIVNSYNLFEDYCPFREYYLKGNQIIALVETEDVRMLKDYFDSDMGKSHLHKVTSIAHDLLDGKISTPSLFFISLL